MDIEDIDNLKNYYLILFGQLPQKGSDIMIVNNSPVFSRSGSKHKIFNISSVEQAIIEISNYAKIKGEEISKFKESKQIFSSFSIDNSLKFRAFQPMFNKADCIIEAFSIRNISRKSTNSFYFFFQGGDLLKIIFPDINY